MMALCPKNVHDASQTDVDGLTEAVHRTREPFASPGGSWGTCRGG
jgi:hypothetical protein